MTAPMSEAAWQSRVTDTLDQFGWKWCHYRPARTEKGWRTPLQGHGGCPDLIIAGYGYVFIAELKRDDPRSCLTTEQSAWILAGGKFAAVWRPADWPSVLHFIAARGAASPIPEGATT